MPLNNTSKFLLVVISCLFVVGLTFTSAQQKQPEIFAEVDGDPIYKLLPPDAIPAIMNPKYYTGKTANHQMYENEPVIGLVIHGEARAYSLWQLDAHEIVNDFVGDTPIAVTW